MWELKYKESWTPMNWRFWTAVLEKTLEGPLDCKEIELVHPKGNQSWTFIGRIDVEVEAPILWPPNAKKWLIWKDSDAGKDWRQEQKGTTKDDRIGWHHLLDGHEFGVAKSRTRMSNWAELNPLQYSCLENSHGMWSLVGYHPRGCKEPDTTEQL